jgi:hypothetical protein
VASKLFTNIKQVFRQFTQKEDNRLFIFLVCLLISSVLWLVNSMGRSYETIIDMPIEYTNLPKNKVLVSSPPEKIQVRVEAEGFAILRTRMQFAVDPVKFDVKVFTNDMMSISGASEYHLVTSHYMRQILRQMNSRINIIDMLPDTLVFKFDQIVEEKKPIRANFDLTFANQFFLSDSIRFFPDSVLAKGPKSVLDSIHYINTKQEVFKKLNTDIEKSVSLVAPKNVELTPERVSTKISVSVFSEYIQTIPISVMNVPKGATLVTFPGNISVSCQIALSQYSSLHSSNFIIGVDYNDIRDGKNTLPVKVVHAPGNIRLLTFSPTEVEYVIENK